MGVQLEPVLDAEQNKQYDDLEWKWTVLWLLSQTGGSLGIFQNRCFENQYFSNKTIIWEWISKMFSFDNYPSKHHMERVTV